jgi:hypothetical protein
MSRFQLVFICWSLVQEHKTVLLHNCGYNNNNNVYFPQTDNRREQTNLIE